MERTAPSLSLEHYKISIPIPKKLPPCITPPNPRASEDASVENQYRWVLAWDEIRTAQTHYWSSIPRPLPALKKGIGVGSSV